MCFFFFQAEDGIRDLVRSRGLGDVYKRQVKLNDPITGHFNSYVPIHPSEIERIEVLKGAASAIYGSEAVGGVINIITKTSVSYTHLTLPTSDLV